MSLRVGVVLLLAALLGCPADAPPDPVDMVVEVTLVPPYAAPGEAVRIEARADPRATLTALVQGLDAPIFLAGSGDATGSFAAPDVLGDRVVEVQGSVDGVELRGFALLQVTTRSCPEGQVPEADGCVTPHDGPALTFSGFLPLTHPPRDMIHPRRSVRVGDTLIACHTDAVALVDLADAIDVRPGAGSEPLDIPMPVAEALVEQAGFRYCDDLAWDGERRLMITTSRGDSGNPGGLAVWRAPDPAARPLTPPVLLDVRLDDDGYERLVLDPDHPGELHAVRDPNVVETLHVLDDGTIVFDRQVLIPTMVSGWGIAQQGRMLYVTDPGVGDPPGDGARHEGDDHEPAPGTGGGGRLFVVDTTDGLTLRGSMEAAGLPKDIAVLPGGVVALANGNEGIELVDVTDPDAPRSLLVQHSHAPVLGLAYDAGYLVAAAWDWMSVYDAGERGVLRLLGSSDVALPQLQGDTYPRGYYPGLNYAAHVDMQGLDFQMMELTATAVGRVVPGGTAPAFDLQSRRYTVDPGPGREDVALRVVNGGRSTLRYHVDAEGLAPNGLQGVLGPGRASEVPLRLRPPARASFEESVPLHSNDPLAPLRRLGIAAQQGLYEIGDPFPDFHLPAINLCQDGDCDNEGCVGPYDVHYAGIPILIAFFSSW